LTVRNGVGVDSVLVNAAELHVGGTTSINLGLGASAVNLGATTVLDLAGPVAISAREGGNFAIGTAGAPLDLGSLTVTGGAGGSNVSVAGTSVTVNGPVSVSAGIGDDNFTFGASTSATVNGGISIRTGPGAADVSIGADQSLTVNGVVLVQNMNTPAAQATTNVVLGTNAAATVTTRGIVLQTLAGDTNTSLNGSTTVNGTGPIVHAAGDDALTVNNNLKVTGSVNISNGDGASVTVFAPGSNVQFGGSFNLVSLNGADSLTISSDSFAVQGLTGINFGNGGS